MAKGAWVCYWCGEYDEEVAWHVAQCPHCFDHLPGDAVYESWHTFIPSKIGMTDQRRRDALRAAMSNAPAWKPERWTVQRLFSDRKVTGSPRVDVEVSEIIRITGADRDTLTEQWLQTPKRGHGVRVVLYRTAI